MRVREHGKSRVANNLFKYGFRTASIILKTYRDYKPLRFFGYIASFLFVLAICFLSFLIYWKITTGGLFPHKWAGFVSGFFAGSALVMVTIGIVAEILDRMRVANDEVLFRIRRLEYMLTENEERDREDAS